MNRRFVTLALAAALLTGSIAVPAVTVTASADGSDAVAVSSKKKCKKKKGATGAKKCKKRKATTPIVPTTPPTPAVPAPASLSISPTSHDFGTVPPGDSPPQTLTVMNGGATSSGTLSSSLSGSDTTNFVISADTCNGTTLAGGSSCTVDVHCTTVDANGVARTATLTIAGTPGGSPSASLLCYETT